MIVTCGWNAGVRSVGFACLAALFSLLLLLYPACCLGATARELDEAVAVLRSIAPEALTEEEQNAKGEEIDGAWEMLQKAGDDGYRRLMLELDRLEQSGEKDDFFRLNASALLWKMKGLDASETIAGIWNSTPLQTQYYYVFYTAFEAAMTQDSRALPMLVACLGDDMGSLYLAPHAMDVEWPLTHEFLWGCYGPKGLPALGRILDTSADPVEVKSAMLLLARAQHLVALPRIRLLAKQGSGEVRAIATRCLGLYGHPQDYDLLVAGLGSDARFESVFALYEYGDLRAVPHLVPLVQAEDEELAYEVAVALVELLTPESMEALHRASAAGGDGEAESPASDALSHVLEALDLDWDSYSGLTSERKAQMVAGLRAREDDRYRLRPDDRHLTHDQLVAATEEWKANRTIAGGTYEWVEDRHVLAAASADDLPRLLDIRASLYTRVSDECLYEVRTLDRIIQRLGRSRYRKDAGVCEQVEPTTAR